MTEHQPATCEKCKCQKPDVKQADDVRVPIEKGKPITRGEVAL